MESISNEILCLACFQFTSLKILVFNKNLFILFLMKPNNNIRSIIVNFCSYSAELPLSKIFLLKCFLTYFHYCVMCQVKISYLGSLYVHESVNSHTFDESYSTSSKSSTNSLSSSISKFILHYLKKSSTHN